VGRRTWLNAKKFPCRAAPWENETQEEPVKHDREEIFEALGISVMIRVINVPRRRRPQSLLVRPNAAPIPSSSTSRNPMRAMTT